MTQSIEDEKYGNLYGDDAYFHIRTVRYVQGFLNQKRETAFKVHYGKVNMCMMYIKNFILIF